MFKVTGLPIAAGLESSKAHFCTWTQNMTTQRTKQSSILSVGTCVTASGLTSTSCSSGNFSRECNTAACAPTAWLVGAWGACSKACADKAGAGMQTRTVGCYQYTNGNTTALVNFNLSDHWNKLCLLQCHGQQSRHHVFSKVIPRRLFHWHYMCCKCCYLYMCKCKSSSDFPRNCRVLVLHNIACSNVKWLAKGRRGRG